MPPVSNSNAVEKEYTTSRNRNLLIIGGIVVIILLAFFPTPHVRIKTEFNSDHLTTLYSSTSLKGGYYRYWELTDLASELKLDVSIDSTEEVIVYIKSTQGVVSNEQQKVHHYSVNCNGPSLYVEVKNPSLLGLGPSAVISGDIKVFHDYEEQVTYNEWIPWWMP